MFEGCDVLERRVLFAATDLDPSFGGGDGKVLTEPGFPLGVVEALPEGGYVAPVTNGFGVARFLENGSLDRSFARGGGDGDGVALTTFGPAVFTPRSSLAAPAPGGRIVVAGHGSVDIGGGSMSGVILVARFNPDGSLDADFGRGGPDGDGRVTIDVPANGPDATAADMIVGTGGMVYLAGTAGDSAHVTRVRADGVLDTAFGGGDGIVLVRPFAAYQAEFVAIDLTPNGHIVAAGTTGRADPEVEFHTDVFVTRLTATGARDTSFDSDGIVTADVGALLSGSASNVGGDVATAMRVLPDGRTAVGAETFADGANGSAILLFSPNGRPVRAVTTGVEDGSIQDFAPIPGGGFVAVGSAPEAGGSAFRTRDFFLAGYRPDGSPHPNYQPTGVADFLAEDDADVVVVRSDGSIDVAGVAREGTLSGLAVARFFGSAPQPPLAQVLEAENARVVGATVARSHPGYSGSGYVDYVNARGDFVEWTVLVPTAGAYELEVWYAHGGSSARSMGLSVNNGTVAPVSFTPTGSWSAWRTVMVPMNLSAGANTVRLAATGQSGPNVDRLIVRPATIAPQPQVLEAERATITGAVVSRSHPGYSGTGYVDFQHASGDSIEWSVQAGEARDYVLEFRYANGSSIARNLVLSVDGPQAALLQFAPTGSWNNWRTETFMIRLTEGTHRVRLHALGNSGGNIDVLTVR